MKKFLRFLLLLAISSMIFISCEEKNKWDPEPGLEKIPPPPKPEVAEKYIKVQDPRIAKEINFWIFSANDTLQNLPYEKGLLVRKTSNLIDIEVVGYVLSDVINNWAKAKLLELDPNIDTTKIRMRLPSIKYDGTQWRLYYSVVSNTQASVIGYAVSPSLENQNWTDKGLVLASKPGDPVKAAGPCFVALPDNSKHYLFYGAKYGGIYVTEIDKNTSQPLNGFGKRVAFYSQDPENNQRIGFPEVVFRNGYYYLFMTCDDEGLYGQNVEVIRSNNIEGPYFSFNGDNYTDAGNYDLNIWNTSHILSPYCMFDSARNKTPGWGETGSIGVVQDGDNWYAVNNARLIKSQVDWDRIICEGPWTLQIRNLEWISTNNGWPVVMPTLYSDEENTITADDIAGDWDYATRWYEYYPKFLNPPGVVFLKFLPDGTMGGDISGTWTYNPATREILMHSATWSAPGGEDIIMIVRRTRDNDYKANGPYPVILAAAGYNLTFGRKPIVWMKQRVKK